MIDFCSLAGESWEVRGDAGADELFVELLEAFLVDGYVLRDGGEVEAESTVELDIDKARSEDLAFEVDDFVGYDVVVVEDFLFAEDLAGDGADPEVFLDELVAFDEVASGEPRYSSARPFWRHCHRHVELVWCVCM